MVFCKSILTIFNEEDIMKEIVVKKYFVLPRADNLKAIIHDIQDWNQSGFKIVAVISTFHYNDLIGSAYLIADKAHENISSTMFAVGMMEEMNIIRRLFQKIDSASLSGGLFDFNARKIGAMVCDHDVVVLATSRIQDDNLVAIISSEGSEVSLHQASNNVIAS